MSLSIFDKFGLSVYGDTWKTGGTIKLMPSGDLDDYISLSTSGDRPLIAGTGNYLCMGADATSGHTIGDTGVIFGGITEFDGAAYFDSTATLTGLLTADGGIDIGSCATGVDFTGTITGNGIDFSSITMVPSGSGGTALLRAGIYSDDGATCATFISNTTDAQGGLIRFYSATKHQSSTAYDRGVFCCLVTTGTKGIYPIAGLAEVRSSASAYPKSVGAGQFIADLHTSTSKVASRTTAATANFYGSVFKVVSEVGSEAQSGSVSAPIWLDTQMNGTKTGENYMAYITTGHTNDAVFGFEVSASGSWDNLFYFDSTCSSSSPISNTSLKVLLDTTQYYIPMSTADGSFTTAYPIISTSTIATTLVAKTTQHIGFTSTQTASSAFTGWSLGFFGSTNLSATSGVVYNAAGGVFEVNLTSDFAASMGGLTCGAYIGGYVNCVGRRLNSVLYLEGIAGSAADLTSDGTGTDSPMIAIVTSGAGTQQNLAIEFGNDAAGKQVLSGNSGDMEYHQTIMCKINGTLMYWPFSTVEGTYTTAYPIYLKEDVVLAFGNSNEVSLSFTGEELLASHTVTLDAEDTFRTFQTSSTVTGYALARFAGIAANVDLVTTGGLVYATGIFASVHQGATKIVDGYLQAGLFELKNHCTSLSTASCITLVWDNSAAAGSDEVMHSFIRCDSDPSSGLHLTNLFDLTGYDATTAAASNTLACVVGNANTVSHSLKITIGGVPYWIMMDNTPPA